MSRNPYYDVLFDSVQIGPVTAPNRFYQTPHATGMGNMKPNSSATLRGIKAEGGWGVVCTEYCSIHPSADDSPYTYLTLWDDEDAHQLSYTSEAIHAHGSLAGIELWHGGFHTNNRETREVTIGPMAGSTEYMQPGQVRAMEISDIKAFRKWHRDAAIRAMQANFDIVYVYAGHEYLPFQFLSPRFNQRSDEYGGSLINRSRLLREMIEDTLEAVGHRCAVAVRLAVDELQGDKGITSEYEGRKIIEYLGEMPDLWDIALGGGLGNDSCSSRFSPEAYQEKYAGFVKTVTSKPVVSVGRFTSPDTMVGQIKRGVQDFIGAARPSIADPFLPAKINQGREDEIRECIGCNICRSANNEGVPLRCTQNPTMGEEWRRGWHPDYIPTKHRESKLLVIGGGPAGLEVSLALGDRGYQVTLAEANDELGGRVVHESSLPGLQHWIRVRDYRRYLIGRMSNVDVYLQSELGAGDIEEFNADQIIIASGSEWRRDGVGTNVHRPVEVSDKAQILTPDDIFSGVELSGDVLIYDDEHYMMAGALAEKLLLAGHSVTYLSPAMMISSWTTMTDEQEFIQSRLISLGINTVFTQKISRIEAAKLITRCIYSEESFEHPFTNLIMITGRLPKADLYYQLEHLKPVRIGDCFVPSSIADAVYSGHKFAREYGEEVANIKPRRERALFQSVSLPLNSGARS
ncbi:MAG: FAD-dependent oxidoreductase [Proteobacteria bacterium]|nr:FAD-dependent oxidoreductase [Pseudomonadota bacterium]